MPHSAARSQGAEGGQEVGKRVTVGGQGVLEGVMMRGADRIAIALRRQDRRIFVHVEEYVPLGKRVAVFRLPVLRGIAAAWEAVALGVRSLMFSANQGEEVSATSPAGVALAVACAGGLAVGLFILLPTVLVRFLVGSRGSPFLLNVLEWVIRLGVFLLYLFVVSRIPDVHRVFAYHGAEHKAVHAYENGARPRVEEVRVYPILHPRCGTSFLLVVVVASLVFFGFLGWPSLSVRIALRLGLLPLLAGASYEVIRFGAAGREGLAWALTGPGLALQRLTTREPDDEQIEVAVEALKAAVDWRVE